MAEEHDQDARGWEDFIRRFQLLSGSPSEIPASKVPSSRLPKATEILNKLRSDEVQETLDIAREIIVTHGQPMPTAQLFPEFVRRDVSLGGENPKATLDSRLRYARKDFVIISGKGWWPADLSPPTSANGLAASTPSMLAASEVPQDAP
jgi:hypothetical protein